MEQARASISDAERKQLYARFQELFAEEAPALLLYYPVYTYGVSDRVRNVQIGSLNNRSGRFDTFADWYILTRRVPANQVPTTAPPTPPSGN
jgi:peptide/nickel transport system substrate-binding protein